MNYTFSISPNEVLKRNNLGKYLDINLSYDTGKYFRNFIVSYILTIVPYCVSLILLKLFGGSYWVIFTALAAGFTQNALGILMHESSHFFISKNKKLNDVLADFLICLPIFNTIAGYRYPHLKHHQFVGTNQDPYWYLYGEYTSRTNLLIVLLQDISGVTAVKSFVIRYLKPSNNAKNKNYFYALAGLCLVQLIIFLCCFYVMGSIFAYFFIWLLPLMTIPIVINRLRTIVEHSPLVFKGEQSQTTISLFPERWLIAPYGYMYHFLHHLRPNIPYYQLSTAYRLLSDKGYSIESHETTEGYCKSFIRILNSL